MNELEACLSILVAAFCYGTWSSIVSYLETNGLTWVQMALLAQCTAFPCICIMWVSMFISKYYFIKNDNDTFLYNELPPSENCDVNNDNCNNVYPSDSFLEYLFSIFPKNKKSWILSISRGFAMAFEDLFCIIALLYVEPGDALLLKTTFSSFSSIFLGIILFGERLTIIIFICGIVSVGGLILICQPQFVFSNENDSDSLSWVGILFVIFASLCTTMDRLILRYSGDIQVHWLAMIIIPYFISFVYAIVQFLLILLVYYFKNMDLDEIWYSWSPFDDNEYGLTLCIVLFGIVVILMEYLFISGYQNGDVGILGIIANFSVPTSYALEIILLNQIDNLYTYVGATVVILSIVCIFIEQYRLSHHL